MMMILRMYLVNVQLRLSPACINPKQLTEKLTGTSSSSPGDMHISADHSLMA